MLKKKKQCRFVRHCISSSSLTCKCWGRKFFFPYNAAPLPKTQKPKTLTCQDKKKKKQKGQVLGRLPSNRSTSRPLCHDWTGVVVVSPPFTVKNSGGERQKKWGNFKGNERDWRKKRGERWRKKTKTERDIIERRTWPEKKEITANKHSRNYYYYYYYLRNQSLLREASPFFYFILFYCNYVFFL